MLELVGLSQKKWYHDTKRPHMIAHIIRFCKLNIVIKNYERTVHKVDHQCHLMLTVDVQRNINCLAFRPRSTSLELLPLYIIYQVNIEHKIFPALPFVLQKVTHQLLTKKIVHYCNILGEEILVFV